MKNELCCPACSGCWTLVDVVSRRVVVQLPPCKCAVCPCMTVFDVAPQWQRHTGSLVRHCRLAARQQLSHWSGTSRGAVNVVRHWCMEGLWSE